MSGFTQMHVHINESGRHDQPGSIEDFGAFRDTIGLARQSDHPAIFDEQILACVNSLRGIDHVAILNQ